MPVSDSRLFQWISKAAVNKGGLTLSPAGALTNAPKHSLGWIKKMLPL